jgi:hypothetical protein
LDSIQFITRHEFREYEEKTQEGFTRLTQLEAEVNGDDKTGRPGLRQDFNLRLDRNRRTYIAWAIGIITEIFLLGLAVLLRSH